MKYLFTFLFITLFVNADYLNTLENNHCIYDISPYQGNLGLCYVDRHETNSSFCNASLSYSDLIDGYVLTDGACVMKNDLKITGLTQNQWNYLMAVLAHILGFTMLFLISFLSILVTRK